jgi:uncharacterized protein YdeI (YjbR/CyaY-like superfamily)
MAEHLPHKTPQDFKKILETSKALLASWEDITPLARNEWLCWIADAKKEETRLRRMSRAREELLAGKRRPCCFAGCSHRKK